MSGLCAGSAVTPDELLLDDEELEELELLDDELLLEDDELEELLVEVRMVTVAVLLVIEPPALETTTV